jgi:hypothetical protein
MGNRCATFGHKTVVTMGLSGVAHSLPSMPKSDLLVRGSVFSKYCVVDSEENNERGGGLVAGCDFRALGQRIAIILDDDLSHVVVHNPVVVVGQIP